MKTIFLAGGSGFIGSTFLKKYNHKYKFFVLVRDKKKNLNNSKEKNKNIIYLFFKNNKQIDKILEKIKVDYFVNLATFYSNRNESADIKKIVLSNILFPSLIINALNKKNLKKIINIGTMQEHYHNSQYFPYNFYAASKKSFETLIEFYKRKYNKIKFLNLKFYETFSKKDNRNKILPIIKKKHKKNILLDISSKNLSLNFLHVDDICRAIDLLISKKINDGNYQIQSKNFTNIVKLIKKYNKDNKNKINYKIHDENFVKINYKIKKLPYWKQTLFIEDYFEKIINEKN
tara:strand:+ start:192 stop:1058 length:867 start_codon:yes stop_codon:yes gene_type:complete